MLSETNKEVQKDQNVVPQLNQTPSSTYFVYNCYIPVVQDYMSQPPPLQVRNSSESFPQLIKNNDSIQMSHLAPGVSIPSFQFGASAPFVTPDDVMRNVQPAQNHFASFILNEQLKTQNQPTKNRIIEGTQTLCDIEIVLISRYFDMKAHVFCPPNNKYTLKEDTNISNAEWLKDRMLFRYKKPIKESFSDMIDQLEKEGEINFKTMIHPVKFAQGGFDNIERQVPKSVKSEKPFPVFIFEIQQLISQFLFTKY
ncbi:unnamed protein product (macronuclear) [Paramecium tetraurelia]|uniref:Uncharacterized protein n=1 Tax=Paramecium tetraurelia TaxID=5888 RepID=A0DLJ3_PARTE|nr:uncharacterized protein GSPATT00018227001 [Paramecium tetraurelia]CAK83910.1 unnamed protein product [Paramecium tetraurelia]|eukprot:XP_001451307.1 hypothetical protein (macronuclear) [Paramecium tetraurelia strain d4-2]